MEEKVIKKGTVVYYAQILEQVGVFEVLELTVRTVEDDWYVGIETKEKQAHLFFEKDIGKHIFFHRHDALITVKEAEQSCKKKVSDEVDYED